MIRLGLMLERSREDESPLVCPIGARRVLQVRGETIWYLGHPFSPRRAAPDNVNGPELRLINGGVGALVEQAANGWATGGSQDDGSYGSRQRLAVAAL